MLQFHRRDQMTTKIGAASYSIDLCSLKTLLALTFQWVSRVLYDYGHVEYISIKYYWNEELKV